MAITARVRKQFFRAVPPSASANTNASASAHELIRIPPTRSTTTEPLSLPPKRQQAKQRRTSASSSPQTSVTSGPAWTPAEHERFLEGLELFPLGPWRRIAEHVGSKNARQTMTHAQKYRQKIARRQRGLKASPARKVLATASTRASVWQQSPSQLQLQSQQSMRVDCSRARNDGYSSVCETRSAPTRAASDHLDSDCGSLPAAEQQASMSLSPFAFDSLEDVVLEELLLLDAALTDDACGSASSAASSADLSLCARSVFGSGGYCADVGGADDDLVAMMTVCDDGEDVSALVDALMRDVEDSSVVDSELQLSTSTGLASPPHGRSDCFDSCIVSPPPLSSPPTSLASLASLAPLESVLFDAFATVLDGVAVTVGAAAAVVGAAGDARDHGNGGSTSHALLSASLDTTLSLSLAQSVFGYCDDSSCLTDLMLDEPTGVSSGSDAALWLVE